MTRAPLSRRTVCSSRMARIAESGLLLPAEEALIHSQIMDMQKGPRPLRVEYAAGGGLLWLAARARSVHRGGLRVQRAVF